MEYDIYIAKNWFSSRETWIRTMLENPRAVSYELNGGEFESDAVYPDSVHFSDNVAIPQPRKEGHCFSGWTSEQDTVFKVNLVLHGYKTVSDVLLNAHWSEDSSCVKNAPAPDTVEVIEGIGDALPLKTFALEKAPLEVFSSLGQYLGRIGAETLRGLRSGRDFSTTLKQAGYMSGVYILRGDGQALRVQVK